MTRRLNFNSPKIIAMVARIILIILITLITLITLDMILGLLHDLIVDVETNTAKYDRKAMLDKYTTLVPDTATAANGTNHSKDDNDAHKSKIPKIRQFNLSRDDLSPVPDSTSDMLSENWNKYLSTLEDSKRFTDAFYHVKHIVVNRLGAGVGSSGNARWYVLVEGPTLSHDDDYILDFKHEPVPEWYAYADHTDREANDRAFKTQGERASKGYRAMSGKYSDALLGWLDAPEPYGSFLVKQRPPCKADLKYGGLTKVSDWIDLTRQWGILLAYNHARGDNDYNEHVIDYSFEKEFVKMLQPSSAHGGHHHKHSHEHSHDKEKSSESNVKDFGKYIIDFSQKYYDRVVSDFKCFNNWDVVNPPPSST